MSISISDQFEDHLHDLLFDIGGVYASQTLIGLSMHSENLFTLVHAARDAITAKNTEDFERISWGIFWYCLHDIDLLLTTELRNITSPYELHGWITGDYYAVLNEAVAKVTSIKPEWGPLKAFITNRVHYSCQSFEWKTPLDTLRQNRRGAKLSICIRAIETLLLQETEPLMNIKSEWSSRRLKEWFVDHDTFNKNKRRKRSSKN
jgi:hypothetical protein